ncbi:MAG: lipoyl synthase [Candidatus Marinimicrobia bacterium]|jgi:lipoic acid synthetase|nr:lipoyl synthase [Candidatus Neomarinimicrobiota bacterium]MBT3936491.1 lipoyl synthase [Candidatus Neomarinimicrobiota bacterium]MBT3962456.1 lipoyl synthase [Candidatus Neomarinimicrobiota bacterium]MBT4383881.1 lipoyl synthase [Candidatus Neomarinimicrobiota bacterium]MBT4636388.1 lipoyl synthase [Candidatus Neomarinimicrobiota bacterium]
MVMISSRPLKPKIQIHYGEKFRSTQSAVKDGQLNTVCEEAKCPNVFECWNLGIATLMILGDICTRACGFCSVKTGKPTWYDLNEPQRTAEAVLKMGLRHVVITSVDRDDLKGDYGSFIWAKTIESIRRLNPACTIEVLTPDFKKDKQALIRVFSAKPDIFSHNLECAEHITKTVRSQASWGTSLDVLRQSVEFGLLTKTGMMVGLGERSDHVLETMEQASNIGVKVFTIGQYLQPTKKHLPVKRYVSDDEFEMYKKEGNKMGFQIVESGPLVRSSYHADQQAKLILKEKK